MENKVSLYGASGHCKVIIDILQKNNVSINTIIDDSHNVETIFNHSVVHSSKINLKELSNIIIAIGNNAIRKKIATSISNSFAKAIHCNAIIGNHVIVEEGTVIMAGAVINSNTTIGKHCIINTGAIVEHDCVVEDYVHISPKAAIAGGVIVKQGTHIGIGASVLQEVKIGKWVVVGAGSVVLTDLPDYAVAVGNPAKIIKYNTHE